MTHAEEVKAGVARMVEACQSCRDNDFCEECSEDIRSFQEREDFDVTDYVSKSVPESLKDGSDS
jgi:hypothetical protein